MVQLSENERKVRILRGDADSMVFTHEAYKTHHVFSELECYIDLYRYLSWSIFSFSSIATNAMSGINYHMYSSIQGKLESIRVILSDDRIDEAYALFKEYYDSVIMNIYSNLYLKDNLRTENVIVAKMINWLNGNEPLPESRIMANYIRSSNKVTAINNLLYADDRYGKIRDRCRDHNKYSPNALLKDNEICVGNRFQRLNAFSADARDVFILHLAYLFFLNDHDMKSSDYPDSLMCEMQPEPDADYWITPFIQEVFDDIIARHRPDIATTIEKYTCMQLL